MNYEKHIRQNLNRHLKKRWKMQKDLVLCPLENGSEVMCYFTHFDKFELRPYIYNNGEYLPKPIYIQTKLEFND